MKPELQMRNEAQITEAKGKMMGCNLCKQLYPEDEMVWAGDDGWICPECNEEREEFLQQKRIRRIQLWAIQP